MIRFAHRIREGGENNACAEPTDGYRTMFDRALAALVQAWITTTIAITLFVTAIALSRVWEVRFTWRGWDRLSPATYEHANGAEGGTPAPAVLL